MTRQEMTEIFAVLALVYPHAEVFKAPNAQTVTATIILWTVCLQEFDSWTIPVLRKCVRLRKRFCRSAKLKSATLI